MFDEMPPRKKASEGLGADRISALPDALLHHVLGFLQAQEAVRTCVLARRWCHLWKSVRVLRVTSGSRVEEVRKFMDHFLLLRDRSNLDMCLLKFTQCLIDDVPYVKLWIQHALLCQVRVLSISVYGMFALSNPPLVSQHLTKLELYGLSLADKRTNFSSCLALKDLNITKCGICAKKIYSRSLERLNCHRCSFSWSMRTHISAPNLISLQLTDWKGRTPFIEDMPLLVTAEVTFRSQCEDYCYCCETCENSNPGYCEDSSCQSCYGLDDASAGSVLLNGSQLQGI